MNDKLSPMGLIILLVSALQFVWGLCLVLGLDIVYISALDGFTKNFPYFFGWIGIFAAVLAYSRVIYDTPSYNVWFLIPQQILLLHSSISIVESAIRGHYPDGTIKPGVFIITDQLSLIFIALKYTYLLITNPSTHEHN